MLEIIARRPLDAMAFQDRNHVRHHLKRSCEELKRCEPFIHESGAGAGSAFRAKAVVLGSHQAMQAAAMKIAKGPGGAAQLQAFIQSE